MAEIVLIQPETTLIVVAAFGIVKTAPRTSQSPGVSEMLVTLAAVPVVSDTGVLEFVAQADGDPPLVTCAQMNSPSLPAFALSFVVVPTMPAVLDGVIVLVACSVVNLPAAAVVPPIAGGDAR
ncbi:hypothetical protein [Paraburkholderia youngii]|uniref:hypothetical protein n=1 Tax=Paraburkholderia youngii TaxID=2782701 RepID=UPI003D2268D0